MMNKIEPGYEYSYYRGQKCKHCNKVVPVFGLGHHVPKSTVDDPFTKRAVYFYKYGTDSDYFLNRFYNLYAERFKDDISFDLICVIPTHEKDTINQNMISLATTFGEKTHVPVDTNTIKRILTTAAQHGIKTKEERILNIKDSLDVTRELTGKNILVFDNATTSGATTQVVFDLLKEHGANIVVFFCTTLGILATKQDFDLNPIFKAKASHILEKLHWPKVPKEARQQFKNQNETKQATKTELA
jgi:predicted amidophosphoribosyltransferase